MKNFKFCLPIFLFLGMLFPRVGAYNLRQISNKDGLSNSAILSICQDQDGFMWFGSCDGLNMFNGLNIQVYKPTRNENNLSGNLIENIIETENGILWIHTNYGLNMFDKRHKVVESYTQFKGTYLIQKDKNNNVFIIKEDNCIYYYHDKSRSFNKIAIEGMLYNDMLNFIVSSDNVLHVIMNNGQNRTYSIVSAKNDEIALLPQETLLHSNNLLYCFHERDITDVIYFIDNTYTLYEYDLVDNKKYYVSNLKDEITGKGEISSIIKHHDDYFVGFKTNGLLHLKYTPDQIDNYRTEDVGIKSGIFCLQKDRRQDLVWIGTDGQGVFMYSNEPYSVRSATFHTFAPNIEKPVRALFLDKEGALWIGTKGDGIIKIPNYDFNVNPTQFSVEYLTSSNSYLSDNSVYAFAASGRNILWIGSENGLSYYSYRDKAIRKIDLMADGKPIKYIHSICELNDTTLWIATVGTGIIKASISGTDDLPVLKNGQRTTVHESEESYNYFFTIYKESASKLWFGNRGYGAFYIDDTQSGLKTLLFDDKWKNQTVNDIFSIMKDSNSNLWFGTSFGLIKHTPTGENYIFNEKDGLPNNTIHGILSDTKENLWLSTNRGIVKFNINQEHFHIYDYLNGLHITEFSDGAAFKDENSGILFFGGINGFVAISETNLSQHAYQPPIYFDNLLIFGEDRNIFDFMHARTKGSTLELNHNQNFFSISFTALDYVNGNNYTYYYKLEDLSKQWIDNGSSNKTSFTSLSPGEYTLYIKYINRLTGVESPVYTLIIKILPPWYMSVWAYAVYAFLLLLIVFFIIRAVDKHNEKKKILAMEKLQKQHEEEVYESKLRFFTNIAHEFCTPLTLIYGPCNRILTHNGSDRFVKKYTQLIQRNAERLNNLIQDLIEFRKIDTGHKLPQVEALPIADIVHDVAGFFNDFSESREIHFEIHVQDALTWNSDKGFLYGILTNLISNAFKYTTIKGQVKVNVHEEKGELAIIVSNTGKGIKKEDISRIFNRYSILDNFENQEAGGSSSRNGLGLAISYSMVKLLDGTIDVNSVLNEQTDFIVKLPQKQISDSKTIVSHFLPERDIRKDHEAVVQMPEYDFDKSKPTVLIIDDDIEILWFISEIFSNEYNTIPINEPSRTEELLSKIHPNIIICDIMMLDINGIALAKSIKANKETAHIPMILLSAKQSVEEQIEGLATGAEMHIAKPFNTDYLRTSVKQLISRKEALKDYFNSPLSAFEFSEGKLTHKENTKFMQKIYSIIDKNIMDKNLSAQFIASELNMSPRHLYRKLNEMNGGSLADVIRDSRLHVAKNFLVNTKMTIDEVIFKSGFSNRATFFRGFAQKYGCTPKEYRDKNINLL